jgi:hypothetical protein
MRLLTIIAMLSLSSCLPDTFSENKIGNVLREGALTVDDVLFDQGAELLASVWLLRSGQDFLSEHAQTNLKQFVERRTELRKRMMEICGKPNTLNDDDKSAIAQIRSDKKLDNSEKKLRIKTLLNDRMTKSSAAIDNCRKEKKTELRPPLEKRDHLKDACMIAFKPDQEIAGRATKKARAWQRVQTLTEEEKYELNRKLESKECLNALSL